MFDLRKLLPQDMFDIRDFDERGVPDGGGDEWHGKETKNWLDIAAKNAMVGKSTIICGFNEPRRIKAVHSDPHPSFELILLDASPDTIRKRLRGRYPTKESEKEIERASGVTLEKFIQDCVNFLPEMRNSCEKDGCLIIETDNKLPSEIAKEISDHILNGIVRSNIF